MFGVAKIATLAEHEIAWSPSVMAVYLWQDAVVALLFAAFGLVARARLSWALYGIAVVYTALNVPLVRVLSTPMTCRMFGATRGALLDSIRHYATSKPPLHLAWSCCGRGVSPVFRRLQARALLILGALGILLAGVGRIAAATVETRGLNRNALFALVESALPRVRPAYAEGNWRRALLGRRRPNPCHV